MNCANCDRPLAKREQPQPMFLGGVKMWPKAFCDDCIQPSARTPAITPQREEDDGHD